MPNYEAGARTPLAAVFASAWLLLLVALMAPLLGLIPLAAIAGLLLLIAGSLFDGPGWQSLWRFSRRDFAIAAATFVATVTIRLEVAILLGTILSLLTYLYRTSKPSLKVMGFDTDAPGRPFIVRAEVPAPLGECPQLKLARMEGEVYFGAVAHVEEQLHDLRAPLAAPKHLLVMSKSMNFIDLAAAEMWKKELRKLRTAGGDLYFHRPRAPVLELWQRIGFLGELGTDHVFPAKRIAIATIFDRLDRGICAHCTVRVFEECTPCRRRSRRSPRARGQALDHRQGRLLPAGLGHRLRKLGLAAGRQQPGIAVFAAEGLDQEVDEDAGARRHVLASRHAGVDGGAEEVPARQHPLERVLEQGLLGDEGDTTPVPKMSRASRRAAPPPSAAARGSERRPARRRWPGRPGRRAPAASRRVRRLSGPTGSARAQTMFGGGNFSSRQCRRARKMTAACAICVTRGSMSMPQSEDDDRRRRSGRIDAGVLPRLLEDVVGAEEEVAGSACGIEHADLVEVDLASLGRRLHEHRQLVGEVGEAGGEVCAEAVVDEEVDHVARGEELVPDGELA